MVNPVNLQNITGQTVGQVAPALTDPNLAQELQSLAYTAYDHCTTPEEVQAVTARIVGALAYAGLPTSGPLMDFVNQCAAAAKQQIGAGQAVNIQGAGGVALNDPSLSDELQTLAGDAFGACTTQRQVQGVLQSIGGSLTAAGLPTSGPLCDYLAQLAAAASQRIGYTAPPVDMSGSPGAIDTSNSGQPPSDYSDPGW